MNLNKFKALLEMIEPSEDYKGGSVSYDYAKELYEYAVKLENVVEAVKNLQPEFGKSPALPWCLESFPDLQDALKRLDEEEK